MHLLFKKFIFTTVKGSQDAIVLKMKSLKDFVKDQRI